MTCHRQRVLLALVVVLACACSSLHRRSPQPEALDASSEQPSGRGSANAGSSATTPDAGAHAAADGGGGGAVEPGSDASSLEPASDAASPDCLHLPPSVCILTLTALSSSEGSWTPSFDPRVDAYRVEVSIWTERVTFTASALGDARMRIDGELLDNADAWASPVLDFGDNVFPLVLSSPGHPTRTISLTVARRAQADVVTAKAPDPADDFGHRVAISGDTLLVAAPFRDSFRGSVYVFARHGTRWVQQTRLHASQAASGDRFGSSIAISGDSVVIGAPGEAGHRGGAHVFTRVGGSWVHEAQLGAGYADTGDAFGQSVAIDGDSVVVSAPLEDSDGVPAVSMPPNELAANSGAVHVFTRHAITHAWTRSAYLKASNPGVDDYFGAGVALHRDTLLASAPYEDGSSPGVNGAPNELAINSGAAYVFVRAGNAWQQQAYLKASNPGGPDPDGDDGDHFGGGDQMQGRSVAIWRDTIAVGAAGEDSRAAGVGGDQSDDLGRDAGAVYVFERNGGAWTQQAYVKAHHPTGGGQFGGALALWGNRMVVGAWQEFGAAPNINGDASDQSVPRAGAAYGFERSAGTWIQKHYLKAPMPSAERDFGWGVALWEDTVVIGAPGISSGSSENSGASFVF